MKNIILLLTLCLMACGCATDYKINCKSNNESSIRIIPKKNPFMPITDSIKNSINIATTYLTDVTAKVDTERVKLLKENIAELNNTSYLQLQLLKGYYEGFRTRPCDDNAYRDYIKNLDKYRQFLVDIQKLNSDLTKIGNSSGITGNNISVVSDRVAKYLATRHE